MSRRWEPPKAKSPQQALGLAERGRFTPAVKPNTDTSLEAAASIGINRAGDLASAMLGVLKQRASKKRLKGVMFAATVRKEVFDYLRAHPEGATADAIADAIEHSILTVRPRVAELHRKMGLITDSGRRAENASGKSAIVWIVAQGDLAMSEPSRYQAPICDACAADPEHGIEECLDRDECGCRKCAQEENRRNA